MDICLILTPRYYRQFSLSLGKFLTFSLNSTHLIRTAIKPLSPKSDQHQFSPKDIHTLARENTLTFYQILSTHSLRKCIEISLENLYVDIGA